MSYKDKTTKRRLYYDEVIRLHFVKGYGEDRIANILPVGHTTVNRWIANFAAENGNLNYESMSKEKHSKQQPTSEPAQTETEVDRLKAEIEMLCQALDYERLKSEAYDTMINIAEKKFNIPIRKKHGARQ